MIEKQFEQYLFENGIAPKTIESYVGDVVMFNQYLREQGVREIQQIKRFYVMSYKKRLIDEDYAITTINKKINSLQAYNLFLLKEGVVSEQVVFLGKDQVKIANGSHKEVEVLSEEQVNRLLFHIQDRSKVTERNELILCLLLYTGVRVSELCKIKIKDIDFITNTLNVFGKGGKHREIPLKMELIEKIQCYIKGQRNESRYRESDFLLVSQRADRLVRDSINTVLEQIAKQVDFKLYPHLFRHTFCTRLIQRGVDITTVSRLAGHSSVTTTSEYYVNTSRQEKQLAVNLL